MIKVKVTMHQPNPSDIKAWFRRDLADAIAGGGAALQTSAHDVRFVDGYVAALVSLALTFGVVLEVSEVDK